MYGLKRDFIKSFLLVFRKISFSGFYFFEENASWWKSIYSGYCVIVFSCIFMIFHARGLIKKYSEEKSLSKISIELGGCLTLAEGIANMIHLIWSRKSIMILIRKLEAEWQNDNSLQPEQIREKDKIINNFDKALTRYFAVVHFTQSLYVTGPLLRNIWNAVVHGHFTRETPFYIEMGFDFQSNIAVFLCVYAVDAYLLFIACWMIVAPVWLITVTMRNLYVMFVTFHHDIRNLVNKLDHGTMKSDMRMLFSRHTKLLNLQDELSGPFGAIFAIHVGILITIIAFYAITALLERGSSNSKNALLAFVCLLASINLLPICYYGQQLTDSSVEVANATYNTAWYTLDTKYRKTLLLMMYRAQRPTYITSTFFTNISIVTFTNVIKSTWSFFSLILTMTER